MAQINNSWGNYTMDYFLFPSQQLDLFNQYMEKYGGMSDNQIYNEIVNVKGQVSAEVVNQHIQNLDAIAQMQGFVDNYTRQRIGVTKGLLTSSTGENARQNANAQYGGGGGLLLWFLILVSIWRRPYGGGWYW